MRTFRHHLRPDDIILINPRAAGIHLDLEALKAKLAVLKTEHRDLDEVIAQLAERAPFDQLQLQRLKKRKLLLKDQISKIEEPNSYPTSSPERSLELLRQRPGECLCGSVPPLILCRLVQHAEGTRMSGADPLVGIIMGSQSDWETMRACLRCPRPAWSSTMSYTSFQRIARPNASMSMQRSARSRGLRVIIAGAGGAAHLSGMVAPDALPVLGVPIESQALKGLDSLLSIVQMPTGVPVGTFAIGDPGAATPHCSRRHPRHPDAAAGRVPTWRAAQTEGVADRPDGDDTVTLAPGATIGILGGGQLGRMPRSPRASWASGAVFDRGRQPAARCAAWHGRRILRSRRARALRGGSGHRHFRVREHSGRGGAMGFGRAPGAAAPRNSRNRAGPLAGKGFSAFDRCRHRRLPRNCRRGGIAPGDARLWLPCGAEERAPGL